MYELKRCPFCGSSAEISKSRCFPEKNIAVFDSEKEATEFLHNYDSELTVAKSYVYRKRRFDVRKHRGVYNTNNWAVRVQYQGFVPRCVNTACLARSTVMFYTEAEAAIAWNARCSDV